MYVIWRSGLQPGRLLHITHILFRCGAMDGGIPACGCSFWKNRFFDDHIYFTLRERLRSFFSKTTEFYKQCHLALLEILYDSIFFPVVYKNLICIHKNCYGIKTYSRLYTFLYLAGLGLVIKYDFFVLTQKCQMALLINNKSRNIFSMKIPIRFFVYFFEKILFFDFLWYFFKD